MTEKVPVRGGDWGGGAQAWSRPPFSERNLVAVKSGFWVSPLLRPDDRAEVEEIAASLREVMPIYAPEFELALEQLACRLWRQRRAYADLAAHGVVREGQPAPVLADLAKLERAIARDLDAFGLTPRAAVALGVDVLRGEATRFTLSQLHALADAERADEVEGGADESGA